MRLIWTSSPYYNKILIEQLQKHKNQIHYTSAISLLVFVFFSFLSRWLHDSLPQELCPSVWYRWTDIQQWVHHECPGMSVSRAGYKYPSVMGKGYNIVCLWSARLLLLLVTTPLKLIGIPMLHILQQTGCVRETTIPPWKVWSSNLLKITEIVLLWNDQPLMPIFYR